MNFSIMNTLNRGFKYITSSTLLTILFVIVILIVFYYGYLNFSKPTYHLNTEGMSNNKQAELLFFYADWCPHCKTAKPVLEELRNDYENRAINGYNIIFTDINCSNETAEVTKMMDKYNIEGFPTIKLLKEGQVIEFDAKPTRANLEEFLNTVL